jgi:hypothetical protein
MTASMRAALEDLGLAALSVVYPGVHPPGSRPTSAMRPGSLQRRSRASSIDRKGRIS